jgi:hypothetical protein
VVHTLVGLHPALLEYAVYELLLAPEQIPVLFLGSLVAPPHDRVVNAHPEVGSELYFFPALGNWYHGCLKCYFFTRSRKYSLIYILPIVLFRHYIAGPPRGCHSFRKFKNYGNTAILRQETQRYGRNHDE